MLHASLLLLALGATDLPRSMTEKGLAELGRRIDGFEARVEAKTRMGAMSGAAVFVRIDDRAELLTTTSLVQAGDTLELIRPDGRRVPCKVSRSDPGLGLVALEADHGLVPVTGPGGPAGPAYSRWRSGARPVSWAAELGPGEAAEAFFRRLPHNPPRGQAVLDQTGRLRGLSFGPSGYGTGEGLYVPWNAIFEFVVGRKAPKVLGQQAFTPADFRP